MTEPLPKFSTLCTSTLRVGFYCMNLGATNNSRKCNIYPILLVLFPPSHRIRWVAIESITGFYLENSYICKLMYALAVAPFQVDTNMQHTRFFSCFFCFVFSFFPQVPVLIPQPHVELIILHSLQCSRRPFWTFVLGCLACVLWVDIWVASILYCSK